MKVSLPLPQRKGHDGVLEIPEGITVLGEDSFSYCSDFSSVIFPSTLLSVGARAFAGCPALVDVDFNEGLREIGEDAFV